MPANAATRSTERTLTRTLRLGPRLARGAEVTWYDTLTNRRSRPPTAQSRLGIEGLDDDEPRAAAGVAGGAQVARQLLDRPTPPQEEEVALQRATS